MADTKTPTVKSAHLSIVKPSTAAQKATRTSLDTIVVTPEIVSSWKLPSFQRELKETKKVLEAAAEIKETQVIPGTLTLGVIEDGRHKTIYLIDGQHRRHAFILSGLLEAFADVRYTFFDDESEMAAEFRKVNSRLATMSPDDNLRAMEKELPTLAKLRRMWPHVGYGQIRRNEKAPILSMSALLRCWRGSGPETPVAGGMNVLEIAEQISMDEIDTLLGFLELALKAWGKGSETHKLWGNLNLAICMWLYRRLVITPYSPSVKQITKEQFRNCLMHVGANSEYCAWLVGRNLRERDRSPTYQRLKHMFAERIQIDQGSGEKPRMPAPAWGGR